MEKRVLVAHASKRGATAEIAEKIGGVLRRNGAQVDVLPVRQVRDLAAYGTVVLGSAVYIGLWRRSAVRFLKKNENRLARIPVWLFISGPTGPEDPVKQMDGWYFPQSLRPVIDRIKPKGITCFGGKLELKAMNFLERAIIRKVNAPIGDFRDWEAVSSWAGGIR